MNQLVPNKIFVVIPFYNESGIIEKVVADVVQYGYRVILVDDGSTVLMEQCFRDLPHVYYLRHKINLGQGAALQTGIQYAIQKNADYIVTFDGDGQHQPADIAGMVIPLLNNETDITLASRFLIKGSHNAPPGKRRLLRLARWINYLFTGLFLTDAHNGLRAISKAASKEIHLKENRMAHATEILSIIRRKKLQYREVPATIRYTEYSKKKGQPSSNSIRIFFDLVLHKLFE